MKDIDLFDRIRASCKRVAQQASQVRIDHQRLCPYTAALPVAESVLAGHDPECHYLDRGEDTAAFFVVLDTVNFGSGYFPHLKKKPGRSGYFTIAGALTDRFKARGPFSARELMLLDAAGCSEIFEQDPGNEPVLQLMEHFARALNDLGRFLQDRFGASFTGLVESAGCSAARLVRLLSEMPFFRDEASYRGQTVFFYKRAQLMAADLSTAFHGEGFGCFRDLDRLTMFADNLVPHVLRVDGILDYDPGLAGRIDAGVPIPAGSEEEVEIRACAVHAVELLTEALRKKNRRLSAAQLDFFLWNRGQQPFYKKDRPRHRTRTVFY